MTAQKEFKEPGENKFARITNNQRIKINVWLGYKIL
jgi:hypothetical protein